MSKKEKTGPKKILFWISPEFAENAKKISEQLLQTKEENYLKSVHTQKSLDDLKELIKDLYVSFDKFGKENKEGLKVINYKDKNTKQYINNINSSILKIYEKTNSISQIRANEILRLQEKNKQEILKSQYKTLENVKRNIEGYKKTMKDRINDIISSKEKINDKNIKYLNEKIQTIVNESTNFLFQIIQIQDNQINQLNENMKKILQNLEKEKEMFKMLQKNQIIDYEEFNSKIKELRKNKEKYLKQITKLEKETNQTKEFLSLNSDYENLKYNYNILEKIYREERIKNVDLKKSRQELLTRNKNLNSIIQNVLKNYQQNKKVEQNIEEYKNLIEKKKEAENKLQIIKQENEKLKKQINKNENKLKQKIKESMKKIDNQKNIQEENKNLKQMINYYKNELNEINTENNELKRRLIVNELPNSPETKNIEMKKKIKELNDEIDYLKNGLPYIQRQGYEWEKYK